MSNIVHHFKAICEFKLELQSGKAQFGSCETLKFDGWPWKTIGHLFYTMSSFVHHFKAICWFKLELQSGNAHFGSNSAIFLVPCDIEIWQMSLKNNRHLFYATSNFVHHFIAISIFKLELQSGNAQFGWKLMILFLSCVTLKYNKAPLICYLKLCELFSSHQWIQIGVNSPEMPNLGQNRRFFYAIWPWNLPDDLEKQKDTSTMPRQALSIILSPYMNSNWS